VSSKAGEVQTQGAALLDIRDAKVTKLVLYPYRDRALADLGLVPESDSPDGEASR
jgi:hypothetical protein